MNDELPMFRKSVHELKWIDTRVERIHAGANEIMMEMTGTSR